MKLSYIIYGLMLLILSVSGINCRSKSDTKLSSTPTTSTGESTKHKPKIITIVPLGNNLSEEFVRSTYREMQKHLQVIQLGSTTPIPSPAYYKPRSRYRADSIISWLSGKAKPNEVLMGITNCDISATKGECKDWGVMGLGYRPGNAAVASNFRLKNKSAFWKIVLHELGHTAGLSHCTVKTCLMRSAEGHDHTSEVTDFCESCKNTFFKIL